MTQQATAILERGTDGLYSCYLEGDNAQYGIAGYGDTAAEAKDDMVQCYHEMKALNAADGIDMPELDFVFRADATHRNYTTRRRTTCYA